MKTITNSMKTAKKSNKGKGGDGGGSGGGGSSILHYFSRRKNALGTPAKQNLSGSDETPSSFLVKESAPTESAHDQNNNNKMANRNIGDADDDGLGTPHSCSMKNNNMDDTPDTHEPTTPPSPPGCDALSNHHNGTINLEGKDKIDSAQSPPSAEETPPTNETELTAPKSPPTPDTWIDSVIDQKENDINTHRKKSDHPSSCNTNNNMEEGESKVKEGVDETPMSLLQEIQDVSPQGDTKRQPHEDEEVNMGTPSTTCTPSTTTSAIVSKSNNFFRNYASSSSSKKPSGKTNKQQQQQQTTKNKPMKRQKLQSNQLFLDFGQTSFGKQTICKICGMLVVHGLDEDSQEHDKICKDYKEGVACIGWKNERAIVTFGKDDRVLEVRPDDAQQHKKKVLEVKKIVDIELGFASSDGRNKKEGTIDDDANMTSYMYISKKRVVGLLMVKRIQRAYELFPSKHGSEGGCSDTVEDNSSSISRSLKPSKALLGVHQIWVHKSHRHRGIASKLVTAARDHLIFGMMVPLELVAFSSPTDEGLRFAKSYVGSDRPLIYDIH